MVYYVLEGMLSLPMKTALIVLSFHLTVQATSTTSEPSVKKNKKKMIIRFILPFEQRIIALLYAAVFHGRIGG